MWIKKAVDLIRDNFTLQREEDRVYLMKKNVKYHLIICPMFLLIELYFFFDTVIKFKKGIYSDPNAFIFYGAILTALVFILVLSVYLWKSSRNHCNLEFVLLHLELVALYGVGLYSILSSEYYYNGYLIFIIAMTLMILFFEFNPFIWMVCGIISIIVSLHKTYNCDDSESYINFVLIVVIVIVMGFWKRYHTIRDLKHKRALEELNKKSEDLLLNILPKKVMEDLRETGKSSPEQYKNVSILFTDIVNFTETAKDLEPAVLISELNDIFGHFDEIVDRYSCTRIKTIGDAYLAVCGLPESDPNHAENLLNCARDFVSYLEKRNETAEIKWKMRIGIHTGEVIAGIVGIHKYIYDIFGDAVNVASRVESLGESMKINISEDSYKLLQGKGIEFTARELLDVKGKGKMQMYFVE